jgi:hypothetical protein
MDGKRHGESHELLSDGTLQNALTAVSDLVVVVDGDGTIERVPGSD